MKKRDIYIATFLLIGILASCESTDQDYDKTPLSYKDLITESEIDIAIEDVHNFIEDQFTTAFINSTAKTSITNTSFLPSCATITTTETSDSYIQTIDFGTSECTLKSGNRVKGIITISFSKRINENSKTINYDLTNLYHNGNLIEGEKDKRLVITNINTSQPTVTHYIDMKISNADGESFYRIGTVIREFIEGFDTPTVWEDNVFAITGNTTTILPSGTIITNTITNPLIVKASCKTAFPVQGTALIIKNQSKGVIDFGNGTCNMQAAYISTGITIPFSLN